MTTPWSTLIPSVLLVGLLGGCFGVPLASLKSELVSEFERQNRILERRAAVEEKDATKNRERAEVDLLLAESAARFEDIARRGIEKARQEDDTLDSLAFANVASSAARIARDEGALQEISGIVKGKCRNDKGPLGVAPRDCAMMQGDPYFLIGTLAAELIDGTSGERDALRKRSGQSFDEWAGQARLPNVRETLLTEFNRLSTAIPELLEVQTALLTAEAPDAFERAYLIRTYHMACSMVVALDAYSALTVGRSENLPRISRVETRAREEEALAHLAKAESIKEDIDRVFAGFPSYREDDEKFLPSGKVNLIGCP